MKLRIENVNKIKLENRTQNHMQRKTCRNHIMKKYITADISVVNKWVNFNCEKCSLVRKRLTVSLNRWKIVHRRLPIYFCCTLQGEILMIISTVL